MIGEEKQEPASFWYTSVHTLVINTLSLVFAFASTVIIARVFGPQLKGEYDLMVATAGVLGMALGLSLPSGVLYVIAQKKAALGSLFWRLLLIVLVQGAFAFSFLTLIRQTELGQAFLPPGADWGTILLITLFMVFSSLLMLWANVYYGRQDILKANYLQLLRNGLPFGVLMLLAGITWWYAQTPSPVLFFAASVLALFLLNGIYVRLLAPSMSRGDSALKEVIRFSIPCYAGNLLQYLNYRMDIFFVSYFQDSYNVGIYSLAMNNAQFIWLVSNAFALNLLPKIAASQGDVQNNAHRSAQVTRFVLWISMGLSVFLGVASWWLFPLIFGEKFVASLPPLMGLLPGIALFSIVNILSSYISGIGKPQVISYISLAGFLLKAGLDIWLIPEYSINGAAIASSLAYITCAILAVGYFSRQTRISPLKLFIPQAEDREQIRGWIKQLTVKLHNLR